MLQRWSSSWLSIAASTASGQWLSGWLNLQQLLQPDTDFGIGKNLLERRIFLNENSFRAAQMISLAEGVFVVTQDMCPLQQHIFSSALGVSHSHDAQEHVSCAFHSADETNRQLIAMRSRRAQRGKSRSFDTLFWSLLPLLDASWGTSFHRRPLNSQLVTT